MMKYAKSTTDFQDNAKDYVINMTSAARKLHKKNGCYYSRMFDKYYDFDTYEQAKASEIGHTDCELCFGKKK